MLSLILMSGFAMADTRAEIVQEINVHAVEVGIDPDLAVAIATTESSLNPKAIGGLGEIGLFQLRPEYHDVRFGDTEHNIKIAVSYLKTIQTKWEPKIGNAWFVMYNCGPYRPPRVFIEQPKQTRYYRDVMRELGRIKTKRYLALN